MLGNSAESDQTPHSVASDPGLRCLPMSSKKKHIWVNPFDANGNYIPFKLE